MGLNNKVVLLLLITFSSMKGFSAISDEEKYLTIKRMKVMEISRDVLNQESIKVMADIDYFPNKNGQLNPINQTGKVIKVARDLVALGESVYKLVQQGKPSNTVKYAPISVVPKVGGEPVDVFATENWRMPKKRTYKVVYENLMGLEVVSFRYSVIFSYGGTYEGLGAYITAAQIVPEAVNTLFGYDFTATMKLGGIQNNGSRINPVASANLLVEYTVSTVLKTALEVDTFNITGRGGLHKL